MLRSYRRTISARDLSTIFRRGKRGKLPLVIWALRRVVRSAERGTKTAMRRLEDQHGIEFLGGKRLKRLGREKARVISRGVGSLNAITSVGGKLAVWRGALVAMPFSRETTGRYRPRLLEPDKIGLS